MNSEWCRRGGIRVNDAQVIEGFDERQGALRGMCRMPSPCHYGRLEVQLFEYNLYSEDTGTVRQRYRGPSTERHTACSLA